MGRKSVQLLPDTQRILTTLGENIQLARLRRRLSVELVAERAGISRATLWSVEKGSPSVRIGIYAQVLLVIGLDRDSEGNRIHYASAMTLLGKKDGSGATDRTSYLDLARLLITSGCQPVKDAEELWRRIVFNIAVSNTDDHLRNHGFLLCDHR